MTMKYNLQFIKDLTQNWLLNILLACYQSAEEFKKRVDKYGTDAYYSENINFYPNDRLINGNSEFTDSQIVLAQGHEELQHIAFLAYCLIQCDAFRPNNVNFNPSVDSRTASLVNMNNMAPSTLSRCLAPRLELWKKGRTTKEASVDFLSLNMKDVIDEVHSRCNQGALLFLDSPRQIIVCDSFVPGAKGGVRLDDAVPDRLKKAVFEAKESYRVSPSHIISIGESRTSVAHIQDALVEDSRLQGRTYDEWKDQMAKQLLR